MTTASLLFMTTKSPLSWAIRTSTWSPWSHVALIDRNNMVIESAPGYGVRRAYRDTALKGASDHAVVAIPARNLDAIVEAAASQVGKPYDYTAVLGVGLHRDWQQNDAWFCSELVAWAFAQAGEPLFRADCMRRVTPQHLWMLAPSVAPATV